MDTFFLSMLLLIMLGTVCGGIYLLMLSFPKTSVPLLASLGIIEPIVLIDAWGEEYYTWVKGIEDGVKWGYVYPFGRIGWVILNQDGTVGGKSIYIKSWKAL